MTILILGANGQLGQELQKVFAGRRDVVALARTFSSELCGDLENRDGLAATLETVKPKVIVNAAAYTAVDKAESEKDRAYAVNADGPAILARYAKGAGALLVHYSTDYVFDGSGQTPWKETDVTGPLNVYGASKLEGEKRIQESACVHLILRTSWVYSSYGENFAKKILRLAKECEKLTIINDRSGTPTGAALLANCTAQIIPRVTDHPDLGGLYHLSASGDTSWYDYALFVLEEARAYGVPLKVLPENVLPVPCASFPTPARRPHNSRLDTEKIRSTFKFDLPHWQEGVRKMLTEVLPDFI